MLSVKECQDVELNILEQIHRYCEKHGLHYLMIYGTLIGAVRHQGFIPWDNDIDIGMPREDFERFLELSKEEPIGDHLYVVHYTTDPRYHYMCIRVCDDRTAVEVPYIREQPTRLGVWVDIFVMDGVTPNKTLYWIQKKKIMLYWYVFRAYVYGTIDNKNLFRKIIKKLILRFIDSNQLNQKITRLVSRYRFEDCEFVANVFTPQYCPLRREDYYSPLPMLFEGHHFYGPRHYDEYLTLCFGNYMQLPPVEKRITHPILAEWINEDAE